MGGGGGRGGGREGLPEGGYTEVGGTARRETVRVRALESLTELAEDALGREGGREGKREEGREW